MAVIIWILIFFTLGFIRLLFHWWPHWVLYAMYKRCPLNKAERVLIVVSFYELVRYPLIEDHVYLTYWTIFYFSGKL